MGHYTELVGQEINYNFDIDFNGNTKHQDEIESLLGDAMYSAEDVNDALETIADLGYDVDLDGSYQFGYDVRDDIHIELYVTINKVEDE